MLSGAYLSQALDALSDSANPRRLYPDEIPERYVDTMLEPAQRRLDALNARLRLLRTSVIFSALSAEACANEVLASCLPAAEATAVDRLSTPEKLLLAPRLGGKPDVLQRGAAPHQDIVDLFKTRNVLVHGKPGKVSGWVGLSGQNDKDSELYRPELVVRYLVAVAHAATLLHHVRPCTAFEMPFSDIYEHRRILDDHLERTGRDLLGVPKPNEPPPTSLALQMERRRYRLARQARDTEE
jgi:hypothetical protein